MMQVSKFTAAIAFALLTASILVVTMLDLHESFGDDAGSCMIEEVNARTDDHNNITSMGKQSPLDAFSSLEQRCTFINKEFDTLQKSINKAGLANPNDDLSAAAAALNKLVSFDIQYRQSSQVFDEADGATTPFNNTSEPGPAATPEERRAKRELDFSISKRSTVRLCHLQLLTAARRLTASLPREAGNANGALGCERGLLSTLEAGAVREAEAEEESSKSLAYLGAYWSEVAINSLAGNPLFGKISTHPSKGMDGARQAWVRDGWGTIAPAGIVDAETYFSKSADIEGFKNPALRILHARRLEEHAKFLAAQDQYDSSSQRYRAMAKLADEVGDAALSAHALSQLSHALKLHGSHEEAITAAKDAVALTMDPLAQFVLASARLSSGLLTTDTLMRAAEMQLRTVAGQLPTEELEVQRARMHSEMMMWRWMSSKDISKCRVVGDAARFLICAIAKFIF
jgi:tetratricopeptide (TPR) repeat protein